MRKILLIIFGLIPFTTLALNFDSDLPYSDPAPDRATEASVGALTEEGILEGNPDGTFLYTRLLNRAEFMKIAMKLVDPNKLMFVPLDCFPDINPTAWYAAPVCQAKAIGIVHGNAVKGVDPQFWFFEPSRSVQYEEAVKILVNVYEIPTPQYFAPVEWYVPFIHADEERGLDLPFQPGHKLTRGQVSRLVARFVAYDRGELDQLLRAESGEAPTDDSDDKTLRGYCDPYICDDGREFPACIDGNRLDYFGDPCTFSEDELHDDEPKPLPEPDPSPVYDPDTDLGTKARFIMLGESSPVLGSIEIFNGSEPFDVTKVTVVFTSASSVNSIQALKVYDEDGVYLGRANLDTSVGSKHYIMNLQNGTWVIPMDEPRYLYVRAIVNGYKSGGVSGEVVDINSITVEGDGYWSNRTYTEGTTENFNAFQTARSNVTDISNGGDTTSVLVSGTDLPIGSYLFAGETGDGTAELRVTDLTFNIEVNDGVTVSNVELGSEGSSDRHSCTAGASTVTCSSIPANFGSFKGAARTLTLYGDVTIPSGVRSPRLSLTLNQPGSVGSAGSVTWTDGDTSFSWVPFDSPVVRGTIFSW